jgi:hypothetical protein
MHVPDILQDASDKAVAVTGIGAGSTFARRKRLQPEVASVNVVEFSGLLKAAMVRRRSVW